MSLLLLGFCLATFSYAQYYCNCGPTTTVDSNLGTVNLQGDTRTIYDTSNCPGTIGPKDLTSLVADLTPGWSYYLRYTVTTCGNSFPTVSAAWIDYNQDYSFTDDERLGSYSTMKDNIQILFTVPSSYLVRPGATRLRVQVQETQATSINPCASFPYGATKDFTVTIGGSYPDSATSTSGGFSSVVIGVVVAVAVVVCVLWTYFRRRGSCNSSSSYQAFSNPPPAYTPSPYVQPATAPAYGYVPPAACYRCSGQRVIFSQCQACGGVGFVQATVAFQRMEGVQPTVMRVECPTCKGKGQAPSSCPSCCL